MVRNESEVTFRSSLNSSGHSNVHLIAICLENMPSNMCTLFGTNFSDDLIYISRQRCIFSLDDEIKILHFILTIIVGFRNPVESGIQCIILKFTLIFNKQIAYLNKLF